MSDDKATMTLNLTQREMVVLEQLAEAHDLSKTALLRQALRLYQKIYTRLQAGEQLTFSGDQQRVIEFIGPGFGLMEAAAPRSDEGNGIAKAADE